ncbi:MAG: hypothetical protein ACOYN5_05645 [Bacteroidales bacterium]
MKELCIRISIIIITMVFILQSCKKTEPVDNDPIIISDSVNYILTYEDSKLITELNGYRFEAAYGTSEPVSYPFLWVQYIDDYLDSTRTVVLNQNEFKTITRHMVANHYNGKMTRYFNHASFPNNVSNSISFAFDHPGFLINFYDPINGTITVIGTIFGIKTQMSQVFTGMFDQYTYKFIHRYLIRYISGISLWPFNYGNWADETPFIVTSELSAPKDVSHYYDESFSTFPYDLKSNMFSSFFNQTNESNYIGISRGAETLDTIILNFNSPDYHIDYKGKTFIDKVADTLYLGLIRDVPNTSNMTLSNYRMVIGDNNLVELFKDMPIQMQFAAFRNGNFYYSNGTMIDKYGVQKTYPLPVSSYGVNIYFGTDKIFAIMNDNGTEKRVEIYSIPL